MESDPNESDDGQTTNLMAQGVDSSIGSQLLKDFMALQPLEFSGGVDISVAKNWMLSIEKHLRTIGSIDVQRVQLATFLLIGGAERWWEVAK